MTVHSPLAAALHSVLASASTDAGHVERLWWLLFWVCTAVFVLVVAATLYAVWRRGVERTSEAALDPAVERRIAISVSVATAVTIAILFGFLVSSFFVERAIAHFGEPSARSIRVVGHQWWWEVHYEDQEPTKEVVTANEIHIPVGAKILLKMTSRDVIHSLWVPSLTGKRDLIPGRETQLVLEADHEGVFRGQCAEFCGHQHAHMALLVVAEEPEKFEAWLASQRNTAPEPQTDSTKRGRDLFVSQTCGMCHNVRGTTATAILGPDLTHVASRSTLAAGTLLNHRGQLAGWIVDPQAIKPGVRMPPNQLQPEDLQALLDYLQTLT